jgi:cellulose synthase operon protein C
MRRFTKLSTAVIIGLSLSACGQKSSEEHYQAAQAFIEQQQLNSAVIELKSALQQSPERADYRLALAEVYVNAGALDDAVKEYQRAIQYSNEPQSFIQQYVNVLYLNGNYPEILELLDDTSSYPHPLRDYLLVYKALTEAELGSTDNAAALFAQLSESAQPDVANFAKAFQALAKTELSQVKQLLAKVPADSVLYYQAVYLRGKIALNENDNANAIALLREYITAHPYQLLPQLLLAQSLVKTNQLDDANAILQPLLKQVPQQPLVNYFSAVIAYEKADFEQARVYIDTAISNGLRSPQARVIAALIAINLQLDNVALNHLDAVKDTLDVFPPAQRLYAVLMLRAGNTEAAQQLLSDKELQHTDIELLSATAFELTKQGSVEAAQNLLQQYRSDEPLSAGELTTLGAVQLRMAGQHNTAIRSLEQALQLDPAADQARIMLLSAYIKQSEFNKAMALADEWIATEERKLAGHNIKTYVALVSEQPEVAAQHIQLVLQQDPKNSLARLFSASLAASTGDDKNAEQKFQALLDDEPQNMQALEQYFAFSRNKGNTDDVFKRIDKAHQAAPQNDSLTLLFASTKHHAGDYRVVLESLNKITTSARERSPMHWAYLIDAHLRLNNPAQALKSARDWYEIQPNSSLAAQAYMQALYANKDYPAALAIVDKQLAMQPENLRFTNIKLQMLDEGGLNTQLLDFSRTLPTTVQQRPEILYFKGKALARLEQYSEAERVLTQSYAKQPHVKTALFLAELYGRKGQADKGVNFLEQHISAHGDNPALQAMLAQLSLHTNSARAIAAYQKMLVEQPDNVLALNNLAWLMLESDTGVALKHAKKAYELRPDHPDVLDTYGKVLISINDYKQAKVMLEASLKARPDAPEVQLHYAEALARNGEAEKARTILQQVKNQSQYAEQVAELMKKLALDQ